MPVKFEPVKVVETAVIVLTVGLSAFSIQACRRTKEQTEQTARQSISKPLIQGRAATKADFDFGIALYYVEGGRSAPYSLGHPLPMRAEIIKQGVGNWPVGHQVSIVQAEITDGQHVTLGVIDGDERAVCSLEDVKLLQ